MLPNPEIADLPAEAYEVIGALYRVEAEIRAQGLAGAAKRAYRQAHAKAVVADFFAWAEAQLQRAALLPSNPLTKALHYALERREGLCVYLDDPDVPIDANHLERALRPIPMGRKIGCSAGAKSAPRRWPHCRASSSPAACTTSTPTTIWSMPYSASTAIPPARSTCSPRGAGSSTSPTTPWARICTA